MTNSSLLISTISYNKKEDLRILSSCLSKWFANPKTLHFVQPAIRYPFKIEKWINLSYLNESTTFVLKSNNWIIGHLSMIINKRKKTKNLNKNRKAMINLEILINDFCL